MGDPGMHSVTVLAPSQGVGVTLLSTGGTTSPDSVGPEILKRPRRPDRRLIGAEGVVRVSQ